MTGARFRIPRRTTAVRPEQRGAVAHYRRAAGVGLIELMIAMVLGLFLVLGLTTVFMSHKESFLVMQRSGDLQENARLAALFLTRNIRHAGYRVDADADPEELFPQTAEAIQGSGAGTGAPTVTIHFQAEDEMVNCLGATVGASGTPAYAGNRYSLDVTGNELECATRTFDDPNAPDAWSTPEPLISNVTAMAVRYGVDSDDDGSVNAYLWADDVTEWDNVLLVRIALLLQSDGAVKPTARADTFDLLGKQVTTPADRRSRKVLELTIALANRLYRVPL